MTETRIEKNCGADALQGTDIKTVKIWDHMIDAGDKPVPNKPQYERGGWEFHCPFCPAIINSHSYLNVGYFQIACENHVNEHGTPEHPLSALN